MTEIDGSNLFYEIPLCNEEGNDNDNLKSNCVSVSNPEVTLNRCGLEFFPDFVTEKESIDLLNDLYATNNHKFVWEGFESKKRVLRFSLMTNDAQDGENKILPKTLEILLDRTRNTIDKACTNPITTVIAEEYTHSQLSQHLNQSKQQATVFETAGTCYFCCNSSETTECNCYVACLPLTVSLIQNINRPEQRQVNCWKLYSPAVNHQTAMILPKCTLVVKRKDILFEWRHRTVKTVASFDSANKNISVDQRVVLLKFYGLSNRLMESKIPCNPEFGYVPNPQSQEEELRRRSKTIPNIEDLLTVIVTTSPVKSNPSTELIENVFKTFRFCGNDFAYKCRKVIICDGCRQRNESTTKKHANYKQSMRNGIVTADQFQNYAIFKENLKRLCKDNHVTAAMINDCLSPFCNTSIAELETRHGYGFALKHALREHVNTPYVIVIQHDRTFMRPTPLKETIETMWHNINIKYVGMSMRSNLLYRDIFIGQYGGKYSNEMFNCVIRPPGLTLDARKYGPNSESIKNMDCGLKGKLRENFKIVAEKYRGSQQYNDHMDWLQSSPLPKDKCQLSLTPTFFWYDNVHICETQHYRDFIFDPQQKMVVKGGFVEDKLSPIIKRTVERLGVKEGHSRFGCFLLDDHSGMFFTAHLDGGNYMTQTEKQELINDQQSKKLLMLEKKR